MAEHRNEELTTEEMLRDMEQLRQTSEESRLTAEQANLRATLVEAQLAVIMAERNNTPPPFPPPAEMDTLLAKMAELEASVKKSALLSAGGIDMDQLCMFPNAKLPDKFRAPDFAKFDGTGDPKTHLAGYVATMSLHNLGSDVMAQMFHQTLQGTALQWFWSLETVKKKTWEDIGAAFVAQYDYNCLIQITMRELESAKQGPKENFSDFVRRWRSLASQMVDRPSEKDQIRIIIRNLQPALASHLWASQTAASFQAFFEAGLAVEEGLQAGIWGKSEPPKVKRTPYTGNQAALFPVNAAGTSSNHMPEVNQVQAQTPPRRRIFTQFNTPRSQVFRNLREKGILQPLPQLPLPAVLPRGHNPNAHCDFHQQQGHFTDECYRLKIAIQDLIDDKKVIPPAQKPNTITNPLPHINHVALTLLEDAASEESNPTALIQQITATEPVPFQGFHSSHILGLNSITLGRPGSILGFSLYLPHSIGRYVGTVRHFPQDEAAPGVKVEDQGPYGEPYLMWYPIAEQHEPSHFACYPQVLDEEYIWDPAPNEYQRKSLEDPHFHDRRFEEWMRICDQVLLEQYMRWFREEGFSEKCKAMEDVSPLEPYLMWDPMAELRVPSHYVINFPCPQTSKEENLWDPETDQYQTEWLEEQINRWAEQRSRIQMEEHMLKLEEEEFRDEYESFHHETTEDVSPLKQKESGGFDPTPHITLVSQPKPNIAIPPTEEVDVIEASADVGKEEDQYREKRAAELRAMYPDEWPTDQNLEELSQESVTGPLDLRAEHGLSMFETGGPSNAWFTTPETEPILEGLPARCPSEQAREGKGQRHDPYAWVSAFDGPERQMSKRRSKRHSLNYFGIRPVSHPYNERQEYEDSGELLYESQIYEAKLRRRLEENKQIEMELIKAIRTEEKFQRKYEFFHPESVNGQRNIVSSLEVVGSGNFDPTTHIVRILKPGHSFGFPSQQKLIPSFFRTGKTTGQDLWRQLTLLRQSLCQNSFPGSPSKRQQVSTMPHGQG